MAPGGLLYVTGSPKNGFIRPSADLESLGAAEPRQGTDRKAAFAALHALKSALRTGA
jgi:hypothetical protein